MNTRPLTWPWLLGYLVVAAVLPWDGLIFDPGLWPHPWKEYADAPALWVPYAVLFGLGAVFLVLWRRGAAEFAQYAAGREPAHLEALRELHERVLGLSVIENLDDADPASVFELHNSSTRELKYTQQQSIASLPADLAELKALLGDDNRARKIEKGLSLLVDQKEVEITKLQNQLKRSGKRRGRGRGGYAGSDDFGSAAARPKKPPKDPELNP